MDAKVNANNRNSTSSRKSNVSDTQYHTRKPQSQTQSDRHSRGDDAGSAFSRNQKFSGRPNTNASTHRDRDRDRDTHSIPVGGPKRSHHQADETDKHLIRPGEEYEGVVKAVKRAVLPVRRDGSSFLHHNRVRPQSTLQCQGASTIRERRQGSSSLHHN